MTLTIVQRFTRNRAEARKIAKEYMHKYRQPFDCIHKFGDPYPAEGDDNNVTLRQCELCTMVIGWVA